MNSKIDFKKTKELVETVLSNIEPEALKKVTGILKSDIQPAQNIKIPIITDDESVKNYIKTFNLDEPNNMIKFFIESYYANIECIADGISSVVKTDFCNSVSKIKSAKRIFDRAMSNKINSNKFEQLINDAQIDLDHGITELEEKLFMVYIPSIRKIDNRGKFEAFIKAKSSLASIDAFTELARESVKTIISAVQLHIVIASANDDNIYDSVINPFEDFKTRLLSGDNCSLLYDYDKESERSFWVEVSDQFERLYDNSEEISECIENCIDNIIII